MFNGMISRLFKWICPATTRLALVCGLSQVRIAALPAIRLFTVVVTDYAEFAVKFCRMSVFLLPAKPKTWK